MILALWLPMKRPLQVTPYLPLVPSSLLIVR